MSTNWYDDALNENSIFEFQLSKSQCKWCICKKCTNPPPYTNPHLGSGGVEPRHSSCCCLLTRGSHHLRRCTYNPQYVRAYVCVCVYVRVCTCVCTCVCACVYHMCIFVLAVACSSRVPWLNTQTRHTHTPMPGLSPPPDEPPPPSPPPPPQPPFAS